MIIGRSPYVEVLVVVAEDRQGHDALRGDVVPVPAHPGRSPPVRLLDLPVLIAPMSPWVSASDPEVTLAPLE